MFKRSNNKTRSDYVAMVGLGITIASIYITLVAYAAATTFKAGYLSYFGIDIRKR